MILHVMKTTNTNMSSKFSAVHQEIDEILGRFFYGIATPRLPWLYQEKFNRSLPYKSLGVKNLKGLLSKLDQQKMVVLIKDPETKEEYVMSASLVAYKQDFLKQCAEKLLDENGGEIMFSSFDGLYRDRFHVKLKYHHFGLTDLDHLCKVSKDIMVVVEANSGEKTIKAVDVRPYNLRKRMKI